MRKHNWITIGLTLLIALMIAVSCEKPQNEPGTPDVVTDSLILTDTSVICKGIVESDGGDSIIERGICWYSESYPPMIENHESPTISDHRMVAGGDLGKFSCELMNLEINKVYYLCAYARNSVGVSYGSENEFVYISADVVWVGNTPTPDTPPVPVLMEELPTVTISPVTDITANQATCHGAITDDGGSAIINRGFCWRTNDDLDYNYICVTESDFAYTLSNLAPNTAYYVRAFAVNEKGIGYSSEISFITLEEEPSFPYIAVLSGDGFISDGDILELHTEYKFGFEMSSSIGLSKFWVWTDGGSAYDGSVSEVVNLDGAESFVYTATVNFLDHAERVISGSVTDNNGVTNTVSFRVSNPSICVHDCEWIRFGPSRFCLVLNGDTINRVYGHSIIATVDHGCSICGSQFAPYIYNDAGEVNQTVWTAVNSMEELETLWEEPTYNWSYGNYCTHCEIYAYYNEREFDKYFCWKDENGRRYLIHTMQYAGPIINNYLGTQCIFSGKVKY